MTPPDPGRLWTIVLEPLPDDVPARVRVRRLLKAAIRGYRLRCRVVRYPTPAEEWAFDRDPPPPPPTEGR